MSLSISLSQLKIAAQEIQDLFGCEPAIDVNADPEEIRALVLEALNERTDQDIFTEESEEVFEKLQKNCSIIEEESKPVPKKERVKKEKGPPKNPEELVKEKIYPEKSPEVVKEKVKEKIIEPVDEVLPGEEIPTLEERITAAKKVSELQAIMEEKENLKMFKSILKNIDDYKKASMLKLDMLEIMEQSGEEPEEKVEPLKPVVKDDPKPTAKKPEMLPADFMPVKIEKKVPKEIQEIDRALRIYGTIEDPKKRVVKDPLQNAIKKKNAGRKRILDGAMWLVRRLVCIDPTLSIEAICDAVYAEGYDRPNRNSVVIRKMEMLNAMEILRDLGKLKE